MRWLLARNLCVRSELCSFATFAASSRIPHDFQLQLRFQPSTSEEAGSTILALEMPEIYSHSQRTSPHAFQSHLGSYPNTLFAFEMSNIESFGPAVGVYGTPGKAASTS